MRFLSAMSTVMVCGLTISAQQVSDRAFRPAINTPAYEVGTGPVVCLDEAHANFHTIEQPMGMNAPGAEQNYQFVLNVVHWWSGRL